MTDFDRQVLRKAIGILEREKEFRTAEDIRRLLWKFRP